MKFDAEYKLDVIKEVKMEPPEASSVMDITQKIPVTSKVFSSKFFFFSIEKF